MKRIITILIAIPITVATLMAVSMGVSHLYLNWKTYPQAREAPDWTVLAQEEIPSLVTFDPDQSRRITQVWIANVGQDAYLRTSDTNWFQNLQRNPTLELRIGGVMFPCATEVISDPDTVDEVHEAFRTKYPRRSAMFRALGVATNTIIELDCQAAEE